MTTAAKIPAATWNALRDDLAKALTRRSGMTAEDLAEHVLNELDGDWVFLRPKSHRALLERVWRAENATDWAKREADHAREWARDCLRDERHMRDRCTFLYGAARARGATVEELGGSLQTQEARG